MRSEKIRKIRKDPVVEISPETTPSPWMNLVPRDKVLDVWPKVRKYINQANEYGLGRFDEHEIFVHLITGVWEMFVMTDYSAAMVGRVENYPQSHAYVVVLFGGEGGHDWSMIGKTVDARAKSLKCGAVDILGRPGWRNILKNAGYRCTHHIYTRELEP